jgi:Cytochrome P460
MPVLNPDRDREITHGFNYAYLKQAPYETDCFRAGCNCSAGSVVACMAPASGQADGEAAPIVGVKIPPGYRDWRLISVAREEANLNDLRAIPGNDVAIKSYREGKLPFRDGTIIARLAWNYLPSEENNKAFWPSPIFRGRAPPNGSRTQENTPRPAAGGSLNLTTANPPTRRCKRPAFPATRPSRLATLCSTVTHLDTENHSRKE